MYYLVIRINNTFISTCAHDDSFNLGCIFLYWEEMTLKFKFSKKKKKSLYKSSVLTHRLNCRFLTGIHDPLNVSTKQCSVSLQEAC